jgi:ADP-ribose pyrophosphatase
MTNTKRLSEKEIYKSKYFRINQVEIQRNGKTFTKDIIERNSSVMVLPITEDNEIYILSQYRDALQKVVLELIAGNMDNNSSPLENAKRELEEEGGLIAKDWKQIATFNMSANLVGELFIFVAKDLVQTQRHPDDDEQIDVLKMPLSEALEKVVKGEIRISSNVASLLLVDKLIKEGKL